MGEVSVRTGITRILVNLTIYAFAIFFGQQVMARNDLPFVQELELTSLERLFIVLGMAALCKRLLGDLVGNFVLMSFSSG